MGYIRKLKCNHDFNYYDKVIYSKKVENDNNVILCIHEKCSKCGKFRNWDELVRVEKDWYLNN